MRFAWRRLWRMKWATSVMASKEETTRPAVEERMDFVKAMAMRFEPIMGVRIYVHMLLLICPDRTPSLCLSEAGPLRHYCFLPPATDALCGDRGRRHCKNINVRQA